MLQLAQTAKLVIPTQVGIQRGKGAEHAKTGVVRCAQFWYRPPPAPGWRNLRCHARLHAV